MINIAKDTANVMKIKMIEEKSKSKNEVNEVNLEIKKAENTCKNTV